MIEPTLPSGYTPTTELGGVTPSLKGMSPEKQTAQLINMGYNRKTIEDAVYTAEHGKRPPGAKGLPSGEFMEIREKLTGKPAIGAGAGAVPGATFFRPSVTGERPAVTTRGAQATSQIPTSINKCLYFIELYI